MSDIPDLAAHVREAFERQGIRPVDVSIRAFPGETIVIVSVSTQVEKALAIGAELDHEIDNGFVTVKQVTSLPETAAGRVKSVRDPRVTKLVEMLDARSRTSEALPSLRYVEDVDGRMQVAVAPRHHLIFGRRGVGKTALMLQAKRQVEASGAATVWLNLQSVRYLGHLRAFLTLASRLCELPISWFGGRPRPPASLKRAETLHARAVALIEAEAVEPRQVETLVPQVQQLLRLYTTETQLPCYVFLDDIHYLSFDEVPKFLDLVHGATRDTPVWIKAAGIKHQMRWFVSEPPTGLQLGHDATEINLDITLQEPERARKFLQSVLDGYVDECDAGPRRRFINRDAIDRLVLASGGVPRDFATLCASAIQQARKRTSARTAGVQDVNNAAGIAAAGKLRELEDDAAAALGSAAEIIDALGLVRDFLLSEQQRTYMRVDFLDKEKNTAPYALIQRLMDLRMLHLINESLSDGHQAGRRAEVYLLDLSQYTGHRLRQKLWVLDLQGGHLILKKTRSKEPVQVGDTARRLTAILRRGPVFPLDSLASAGASSDGPGPRT